MTSEDIPHKLLAEENAPNLVGSYSGVRSPWETLSVSRHESHVLVRPTGGMRWKTKQLTSRTIGLDGELVTVCMRLMLLAGPHGSNVEAAGLSLPSRHTLSSQQTLPSSNVVHSCCTMRPERAFLQVSSREGTLPGHCPLEWGDLKLPHMLPKTHTPHFVILHTFLVNVRGKRGKSWELDQ